MKSGLRLAVVLGISGFFVWLSMRDVPVRVVWDALRSANWGGFVLVCLVTLFGFYLRAVRWRLFIQTDRRLPTDSLFSATMVGFMANNVLPFRLGEFIRPWVLSRREKLSKSTLLATIVVERAVDMLTLLLIFGVSLLIHPIAETTEAGRLVQWGARTLLALCVGLTVFVVALERSPALARRVIHAATGPLPAAIRNRTTRMLEHFLHGLGLFRDLPKLTVTFALSIVMFLCFALALAISMASMHLAVPWYAGLVMLVITAIGIMVPAAPGYVGTLHYACTVGLQLFGIEKLQSAPFGWFYFLSQWLPITLVGFLYLGREGLSLGSLQTAQTEGE